MRELHVIGVSDDGQRVLLAGQVDAARPSHSIALDDRLEEALRGTAPAVEPAQDHAADVPEPTMSPKEIQARIRAGASVEQLAAQSGMAAERIARYAGPVLSERDRELAALLACVQVSRRGCSSLPLGDAVGAAVGSLAFVRPGSVEWMAFRPDNGQWTARLSLTLRGRSKVAQWTRADEGGQVRPLDLWALALGHVDAPGSRRPQPVVKKTAVKKAVAKKTAVRKTAVKKTAVKKAVAKKTAAARRGRA